MKTEALEQAVAQDERLRYREEKKQNYLKKVRTCAVALLVAVLLKNVVCMDVKPDLKKYCREKDRLATSDEMDEYLLVDVEINSSITLQCSYCKDEGVAQQAKIWHWQDRDQSGEEREVELGMDNNITLNRLRAKADYSLFIQAFLEEDAGIYRCYGQQGQERDNKYNYRLEPVFVDESYDEVQKGNLTDWEQYREINLVPVTLRFAISTMRELFAIREYGVKLEVISIWSPWSPCGECTAARRGNKTSRGFCRIKRHFNNVTEDSEVAQFFRKWPLIPCRSRVLQERFPTVSNATKHLPEFVLVEKCKHCKKDKKPKKNKFKYKKRYVLAQGAHLAISCPEASMESDVVWRKDSLLMSKGKGHSFRKKDPEPRVLVDNYYSIYLKDVSEDEQGNYTCFVGDVRMMQVKIVVAPKRGLLTEGLLI